MSIFRDFNTEFSDFLWELAKTSNEQGFIARNFLLDNCIGKKRAESYDEEGAVARHSDYSAWEQAHIGYFKNKVRTDGHDGAPPKTLDPYDIESYPETFRFMDKSSPFINSDSELRLVRVIPCYSIAQKNEVPIDKLIDCANNFLEIRRSEPNNKELKDLKEFLDSCLNIWLKERDWRPVFSAYWQDVMDILPEEPDKAPNDWADKLRDRMGLARHDPIYGPIPIFVFQYPIRILPRFKNIDRGYPLVPPSVLDGEFSPAFCPAPENMLTGHTVDIGGNPEASPCREVLHPAIKLRAEHLFRVGTIRRPLKMENLRDYRAFHILAIQENTGSPDFADSTDKDILL